MNWIQGLRITTAAMFCVLSLTACEVENADDKGSDKGRMKLDDTNIVITNNKQIPEYNVLRYFQSQNPHAQVEKSFRFTATSTRAYRVDEHSFNSAGCTGGAATFSMFLFRGSNVFEVPIGREFEAVGNDVFRAVVTNSGLCQTLDLRFSLIYAD